MVMLTTFIRAAAAQGRSSAADRGGAGARRRAAGGRRRRSCRQRAMTVRLGSRGSRLALWQAEHVQGRLEQRHPGLRVEILILRTTGDRITDVPLARIGDKGLFTKEIDRAFSRGGGCGRPFAEGRAHSTRRGLALGAVLEREDPSDVFLRGRTTRRASRRCRRVHASAPARSGVGPSSYTTARTSPSWTCGATSTPAWRASPRRPLRRGAILARAGSTAGPRGGRRARSSTRRPGCRPSGRAPSASPSVRGHGPARTLLAPLITPRPPPRRPPSARSFATLEGRLPDPHRRARHDRADGDSGCTDSWPRSTGSALRGSRRPARRQAEAIGRDLARQLLDQGADEILAALRGLEHLRTPTRQRTMSAPGLATGREDPHPYGARARFGRPGTAGLVFTNGCFDLLHRGHVEYL